MFGRRILGGAPDGFKLLLGYQVASNLLVNPLSDAAGVWINKSCYPFINMLFPDMLSMPSKTRT